MKFLQGKLIKTKFVRYNEVRYNGLQIYEEKKRK